MKTAKFFAAAGLAALLTINPASAQDVGNQFDLGDIISVVGGNRGGYYPGGNRGGVDVADVIGIAGAIYQATQRNRQPYYYPQPGYYPQNRPGYYPPQNDPRYYPQDYPYNQPAYYPNQQPYYYPNQQPYYYPGR